MNAEGQHERQRIGQAKCQRIDHRTPAITSGVAGGNSVLDDSSSRILVDTRRIKKERNCVQINNENGNDNANDNSAAGSSENGHQNSRVASNNNMCRNISNGFHPREVLQEVIAAKWGQSAHGADNTSKNDKLRLMIEDSLSEESKNRVQEIFVQVEQLKTEEKFLLYLRLPACLTNSGGGVDPLKQPLNPLGNRYEIQQTIMWIKTHLEEDPDVSLPKQEVYDEYNVFCIRNSMKPLSTADFGKVMKQVYPRVRPRRLGTRGNSRYCYAGMRKRIKLDTPTLPAVTDSAEADEFDEPITEEMLGAASILIREWAESLLKMKFSSLSALARHLVDNLRVDSRSLAAVCILSASGDGQSSSNNKVSETSPSLSVTPVAGKPGKMREAQLQLQRKLQQREHSRDQKLHVSGKEKPSESPTTPTPTTTARSSSSIGRGCKKSKTGPSPHCPTAILATGPSPRSSSQPAATVSPARTRKLPRSSSQAASPQLNCDNTSNSKKEIDPVTSRCWTPNESVQSKHPTKNTRKRASLELTRQSTETSPEKQAKFTTENSEMHNKQPSPRKADKITVVIPNCPTALKICKTEQVCNTKKIAKTKEVEKITNGRFQDNRLDDKLCTIDPDALDDYLNGGNNSQEQEEELLQYFQQTEAEATTASNVLTNLEAEQTSRSDKVSQLRLILQQNLKATAPSENSVEASTTTNLGAGRETPIVEIKTPASNKQQHDIVLPILLNHHTNHTSGTRRRVSFETSVVEQQVNQTGAPSNSALGTVPQSPNTRRRTFNFTPISPGPHSPINGRPATQASKPNSANVSPFVSPRNTPVPRSRSNLQGGISRSRGNQKSLARSISCSVPYTGMRNETFVVPTSNADNTRLVIASVGNLNCPKNTAQVQVGGNISSRLISGESNDEHKVLPAGCSVQFLSGGDLNPQKQLLINYPSQENLQEIKNVYGTVDANATSGHLSRNSQPADQEISELLNGAAVKQQPFTTEQLFYRSQSVPLHRMVNPTLMSPIGTIQQYLTGLNPQNFNNSSNSSIAPTPVPSEFNDFGTIGGDAYLLDDVDTGFIADDQQFFMEDKESINKILNILDQEGRQLRNMENVSTEENLIDGGLSIPLLEANIQPEVILDPAAVLDPSVGLEKIIESRSYPNTPLPIVANNNYTGHGFTEDNSNGSRSYPSTPLHTIAQQDVYRESNEPMLSSPTLNSLNLRNDNGETVVVESVSRNVADLLETNFLADNEADPDDLGTLGNFDGLQDVDSLAPLFNEVTDNNNR